MAPFWASKAPEINPDDADPDQLFDFDPDPAFQSDADTDPGSRRKIMWIRIRISKIMQHFLYSTV